jgi:hypothetical protein
MFLKGFLMGDRQLFSYLNADKIREYLKEEYGIGVNLPCIHIEEPKRGQELYKFVIGVYTYTHKGLYVIEGTAINDRVGMSGIKSSGILYIFENERVRDVKQWIGDNVEWVHTLLTQ